MEREAPSSGARAGSGRALRAGWVLAAAVAVAALVWAATARDRSVPVVRDEMTWRPAPARFAGSESCRECHRGIVEQQERSAHALTLRRLGGEPAGGHVTGQPVRDPLTGAEYRIEFRDGRHRLRLASGGLEAEATLEWEFGSGRHAHGYLGRTATGDVVDGRINWYRATAGWDFASGQEKPTRTLLTQPLGRPLPPAEVARCFSCHTTQLWAEGATRAGVSGELLRLRTRKTVAGVQCEACHGPRAEHVARFRAGGAFTPAPRLTAAETNELCGRCHSRSDLRTDTEVIARFQPWGLERSRCFIRSGGHLSCGTCHDPHGDAHSGHAYYEAKCRSCHAPERPAGGQPMPRPALCPVNPRAGSVGCHMPRDSASMLHMTFTDHRIRVVEERAPASAGARRGPLRHAAGATP